MYARKNQIYVGSLNNPTFYFDNSQIISCPTAQAVALVGQELSVDVFNPVVSIKETDMLNVTHFRSSDNQEIVTGVGQIYTVNVEENKAGSNIIDLEYGTPVWYYHDDKLVGKFYVDTVNRQARNRYQLNCVSAIGLLDRKMHGGELYTGSTFGTVLAEILAEGIHGTGNPVIEYEIDDDVAEIPVSGWLPYASKRNNLYQLIFANGVNIVKNQDGKPRFTFVYSGTSVTDIKAENIYTGGSVEYEKAYSRVNVFEHTYTADLSAEPETLYETTHNVSNKEVWFENAPVIVSTIASDTLTIVSATENSAVISGNGTLTGIPYTHSTHSIYKSNPNATGEKVISVEDCTMVSLLNSDNLLNRLYAFYCPSDTIKKVSNSIIYNAERCGKSYLFQNPYGEIEPAFLSSIDITASSVNKAECQWYANYEPAGQSGLYKHVAIIVPTWDDVNKEWIYSGTWTVPEDVTEFKVVLIGGGKGGSSGWPGENGQDAQYHVDMEKNADISAIWYGAEGGEGGEGGDGGTAGKVKEFTIQNATPGSSYSYVLGQGGDGGAATGFIPDTVDELREALENEDPDTSYSDTQITNMIAQENTDWNGSPNTGTAGTNTSITSPNSTVYSTGDNDAYVPTGGVYEPINDEFYALKGKAGIKGGKGGARKVENNGNFTWVTDGESVTDENGKIYNGGITGQEMTEIDGLPEADIIAYGGNGAGAAVGIDRISHSHMDGGSDQYAWWNIEEDEE